MENCLYRLLRRRHSRHVPISERRGTCAGTAPAPGARGNGPKRTLPLRFVICLSALAAAGPAQGFVETYTSTIGAQGKNSTGEYVPSQTHSVGPVPADDGMGHLLLSSFTDHVKAPTDSGFAEVTASAKFGPSPGGASLIGVKVSGGAYLKRLPRSQAGYVEAYGNMQVRFTDGVTLSVTSPGGNPGPLLVQGFVTLHGSISASSTTGGTLVGGEANALIMVKGAAIEGGFVDTFDGLTYVYKQIYQAADKPPEYLGDQELRIVPFSLLTDPHGFFPIEYVLFASGRAYATDANGVVDANEGSVSSEFSSSFENTLDWGGITSVTDAGTGLAVPDWTIASESGFDYSQVFPTVPLPGSLVLLVSAVAVAVAAAATATPLRRRSVC